MLYPQLFKQLESVRGNMEKDTPWDQFDWLQHWLDHQIKFAAAWATKVVDRMLHNLSALLHGSFKTVQDSNRYRKDVAKAVSGKPAGGAALPQPV